MYIVRAVFFSVALVYIRSKAWCRGQEDVRIRIGLDIDISLCRLCQTTKVGMSGEQASLQAPSGPHSGMALNARLNATISFEKVAGNLGKGGYESDSS